jgi:ketosteroid isomerase-like protein
MGTEENRRLVEELWAAMGRGDFDAPMASLHEDFVQEWPQSGERIRGAENAMAINRNYPGFPTATPRRTVADGDLVVTEVALDYGHGPIHAVSIFEFRDGKIVKETDYFADPFQAPGWRARWVERM